MNGQLTSLVSALPVLPASEDDLFHQIADLAEVARKLGLVSAAAYLEAELDHSRKWNGPKPLHPEQLTGEVHLCNSDPTRVRYIGWKSKRAGTVAFDINGKPVAGEVPVFVSAEELAKAGQLTARDTVAR